MELKSRSFTSKEPHVARESQVADPWSSGYHYVSLCIVCIYKEHFFAGYCDLFCEETEQFISGGYLSVP